MECRKCKYYYTNSQDFNECKLLHWECCREDENCTVVNDDGSINQKELDGYPL